MHDGRSSILRHDLSKENSGLVPFAARVSTTREISPMKSRRVPVCAESRLILRRGQKSKKDGLYLMLTWARFGSYLRHVTPRRPKPTMQRYKLFFYYVTNAQAVFHLRWYGHPIFPIVSLYARRNPKSIRTFLDVRMHAHV